MADIINIAALATPLESFVKDMANFQTAVDGEMLALFIRACDMLQQQLQYLRDGHDKAVAKQDSLIEEIRQNHAARLEIHEAEAEESSGIADKYTALLSQALDCMTDGANLLMQWQSEGIDAQQQQQLINSMQALADTAANASYPEVAAVAHALTAFYRRATSNVEALDEGFFVLAHKGHDELDDMMDIIAAQQLVESADTLIEQLNQAPQFVDTEAQAGQAIVDSEEGTWPPLAAVETFEVDSLDDEAVASEISNEDKQWNALDTEEYGELPLAEIDEPDQPAQQAQDQAQQTPAAIIQFAQQIAAAEEELLEIFTEEVAELLELLEPIVADCLEQQSIDADSINEIKRILHTLKGGARLAELSVLGDVTHDYETMLEKAEAHHRFDADFFQQMAQYQQQLLQLIDFILSQGTLEQAQQIAATTPAFVAATAQAELPAETAVEAVIEASEMASAPSLSSNIDQALKNLAEELAQADPETIDIFMEEVMELAAQLESAASEWLANPEDIQQADELKRVLHTIKGGARMAELKTLGNITHDYESMIELAEAQQNFDQTFFASLQQYQDQVQSLVDSLSSSASAAAPAIEPVVVMAAPVSAPPQPIAEPPVAKVKLTISPDADEDLLTLFKDEAKEQIEMLKKHCDHMRDDVCMEFIKGYLTALQDYRDKYQSGFTQIQILYIGYHIYQWLSDRHLKETK